MELYNSGGSRLSVPHVPLVTGLAQHCSNVLLNAYHLAKQLELDRDLAILLPCFARR